MKKLYSAIISPFFLWKSFFSILIIGIIFLASFPAYGQNELDDLLYQLSKSQRNTNRVWILRDYHKDDHLDSAIHYSERGFNLARDLGFPQGQIWNLYQKTFRFRPSGLW